MKIKNKIVIPFLSLIFCFLPLISVDKEIIFLQNFIKPGDLVFDIGANVGEKTELYLQNGAKVICVEPQPDCCKVLEKKFGHDKNVTILQNGLGAQPGQLSLFVCSKANTISTFSKEWMNGRFKNQGYTWDKQIIVNLTTLDNVIQKYGKPKFCKIDVENFEYEVLQGLSQPIDFISLEFAFETLNNTQKCIDHLAKLGYKYFNFTIATSPELILNDWISPDKIIDIIKKISTTNKLGNTLWGDLYAQYK